MDEARINVGVHRGCVMLAVWGGQRGPARLTPERAKQLARSLLRMADLIEDEVVEDRILGGGIVQDE